MGVNPGLADPAAGCTSGCCGKDTEVVTANAGKGAGSAEEQQGCSKEAPEAPKETVKTEAPKPCTAGCCGASKAVPVAADAAPPSAGCCSSNEKSCCGGGANEEHKSHHHQAHSHEHGPSDPEHLHGKGCGHLAVVHKVPGEVHVGFLEEHGKVECFTVNASSRSLSFLTFRLSAQTPSEMQGHQHDRTT